MEERDELPSQFAQGTEHPSLSLEVTFQVGNMDDLVFDVEIQFLQEKSCEVLVDEVIGGPPAGEVAQAFAEISDRRLAVPFDFVLVNNLDQRLDEAKFRARGDDGI